MMRAALLALAFAGLGACGALDTPCNFSETGSISLTSIAERDTVVASSEGASCARATLRLQIRSAGGRTVFETSSPAAQQLGGVVLSINETSVRGFLAGWAAQSVTYTALAPPWEQLDADANVALSRDEYEAVRARQLRMVCPTIARDRVSCVYWDPDAERAVHLFDRRVHTE
jgi:hypothetical protein